METTKEEREAWRQAVEADQSYLDTFLGEEFLRLLDDADLCADLEDELDDLKGECLDLEKWVADLQSKLYVNCVYCGHRYGPEDEVPTTMAQVLKDHIEQCPKHPMSELKERLESHEKFVRIVQAELDRRNSHDPQVWAGYIRAGLDQLNRELDK